MTTEKTYIAIFTSKSNQTTELFKGKSVKEARNYARFFKAHHLHSGYTVKVRLLK